MIFIIIDEKFLRKEIFNCDKVNIMNSLVRKFFSGKGEIPFKEAIFLSVEKEAKWDDISRKAPDLPRGWFELSRVTERDRVEFTRDFWLDRIPYHPRAHPAFFEFFEELDDVAVILMRQGDSEEFNAELVYSLADDSCFFRGRPPAKEEELEELKREIEGHLPQDYLSFCHIHNGFGKLSEMGLIEIGELPYARRRVMELLMKHPMEADPGALVPFFEALGLDSFQCFYSDWYPGNEMGNVFISGIDSTISDLSDKRNWTDQKAFASFSEWLMHYLQGMSLCT
jgi:hypothetical protein